MRQAEAFDDFYLSKSFCLTARIPMALATSWVPDSPFKILPNNRPSEIHRDQVETKRLTFWLPVLRLTCLWLVSHFPSFSHPASTYINGNKCHGPGIYLTNQDRVLDFVHGRENKDQHKQQDANISNPRCLRLPEFATLQSFRNWLLWVG